MLALASASTSYTLNSLSSRRAATAAQPQLTMAASNTNWAAAPLAAALAASTIASAAHAAEPWAYSTLVNNIETDAVAKVVFNCSDTRFPILSAELVFPEEEGEEDDEEEDEDDDESGE